MLFLSILKIIGIVLLSIVGVLLLLIFLVLFVPFRYRVCGSFHEEIPEGEAAVGWLCSFIKVGVCLKKGEPITAKLYLIGIPIRDLMKKKQEKSESFEMQTEAPAKNQQEAAVDAKPSCREEEPRDTSVEVRPEAQIAKKADESFELETAAATEEPKVTQKEASVKPEKKKKAPWTERIRKKIDALRQQVLTLYQQIRTAVTDKTDRLSKLYTLWNDPRYAKDRALLLRKIRQVLGHILPTGGTGRILFGTGDPFSTGQVMEAAVMLYPLWSEHIELIPEFSESVIDADLKIRGRIRLVVIVVAAGRIFFSGKLRKMYRKARKILQ